MTYRMPSAWAALAFFVACLGLGPFSTEAQGQALSLRADGHTAEVYGLIDYRAPEIFAEFMAQNPNVKHLILVDMPGSQSEDATLALSRHIRKLGLSTHVRSSSHIASGATDVFIAGVERTSECGARIGVHSWAYDNPEGRSYSARDVERDPTHPDHAPTVQFYAEMGIPTKFYWFTIAVAPYEGMHYMTPAELEHFELVTEPMACEAR